MFESFSFSDSHGDGVGFRFDIEWVLVDDIPMWEDALWEGLSWGEGSKVGSESERFRDGEVGFDSK